MIDFFPFCLESLSTGLPEQVHQIFVRASDLNIVCEAKPVAINQPCDMLVKVWKIFCLNENEKKIISSRLLLIMHQL